jgi:hypothetical protein
MEDNMTTTQLNAELFRELNIIVTDDGLMQKAIKALRRITAEKKAEDETNYIMSSPTMMEILEKGDEEIKKGDFETTKVEDLWN